MNGEGKQRYINSSVDHGARDPNTGLPATLVRVWYMDHHMRKHIVHTYIDRYAHPIKIEAAKTVLTAKLLTEPKNDNSSSESIYPTTAHNQSAAPA